MAKKKKSSRAIWIVLGLLVLLAIAAILTKKDRNSMIVEVETPVLRNIISTVSASGKIRPESEVKIFSEVNGQVIELAIKEGDQVKAGDLLLKVDPELFRTALQRTDAALSSSRASLANAKARAAQAEAQYVLAENTFKRSQSLFESGAISLSEFENATSQFQVARAEKEAASESIKSANYAITSAKATKDEALENLSRAVVYAPQDGIVTALSIEKGDVILGTGMMKGDELMRISDLSIMEVDVDVNESDIVRVGLQDTALVEVDAYPERKFKGLVTEIANTALNSGLMSTDQVTNFSVKIRILEDSYGDLLSGKPDSFSPFRSGMSANVDIQTDYINDALAVPITAVTTRTDTTHIDNKSDDDSDDTLDDEECTLVFVQVGDESQVRLVELGIQDDEYYQIESGITKDDQIIIGPYDAVSKKLKNGTGISVKEKK
ncbi:MAG: efflux RND transporter periplasmic adaptor subunit [Flavobacteriales bacterium]